MVIQKVRKEKSNLIFFFYNPVAAHPQHSATYAQLSELTEIL